MDNSLFIDDFPINISILGDWFPSSITERYHRRTEWDRVKSIEVYAPAISRSLHSQVTSPTDPGSKHIFFWPCGWNLSHLVTRVGPRLNKKWERLVSSKILTEFCVNLIGFLWPNPSPSSHRKPGYVKRKSRVLLQIGHDLSFTEIQKQSGLKPLLLVGCWWVQATKVPGWGPIIVIPWIEMEHDGTQTGYPISKPW